ncbi:YsnF/AvaK domain-containing protein [Deinococcus hopiensis]|uniref:Uncharacterized protein conserved in bacteria n=1 Tax=Deinococcus hopiensis KR-140 TaxID=695939 RepID=A0A1W1VDR7_9DEIO|nr:YsnF/AvaK domain-containing protein [Deinococcus hopiensis]SMB91518.1 Uncharacterized protein conserved in bacteria [Deinococcus hopiensis KR-140]
MDEQKRDALQRDTIEEGQVERVPSEATTETLIAQTLTDQAIAERDVTTRTGSTETHTGEAVLDTGELARTLAQAGVEARVGAGTQTASTQSVSTHTQESRPPGLQSLTPQSVQAERLVERGEGRQILNHLVLHEERAQVEIERERAGQVVIRRVVTEREEVVPITLRREVVEITVTEGGNGSVVLNGEPLEVGRTYEFEMYEERAEVQKRVYPFQEITIAKQLQAFTQTENITLRREELDVEKVEVPSDVLNVENVHTTVTQGGISGNTTVRVDDTNR